MSAQEASSEISKKKASRIRILVVDDEPVLCELFETVLTSAGMDVRAISHSQDAVEPLRKEKFDAVFLDVRMPTPDGFELARQMRASGFNIKTPIVMITGDSDPAVLKRGFEAGANFFLFKPVDQRGLLRLVRATQGSIQQEKRRYQRVGVSCRVTVESGGQRFSGSTLDLSLNGLLIQADGSIPIGSRVDVKLNLSEGSPLQARGLVVRLLESNRMGILLDNISLGESGRLQEFLLPLILAAM